MLTLDSNTLTYDALGRVVEVGASGAYTQTWYTPVGTKVLMNGSKIVKAHLPMPGGLSADWTPTATYINHKDWIGSTRLSTQAGAVYTDQALGAYGENTAQEYGASGEFNYAGLTQDIETSVFDTPAREYMPFQSRWPSVDPAHRSWNGYAYVTDPLSGADRTGLGENGETGNDPNSPPNDGSPTYYQYDEMGPDTASIAMSDDTIDGSLPQLTATVDTIISDSTQAYIGGYSTDFQGTDANNGELVFGANVYAPTPTGSTVSQSSSDSSGGFLDNSVNLASGVPAPATNSDPPCKIGNCTYTIYTEPHYPPGNACSGAHNEKGKPATFVSLWDCVGTVSNCKQNQHFYQDSCDNAGNTPMECMYECNLQAGACSYTCQCCNYR
jgi:RHS repeat-associated protein